MKKYYICYVARKNSKGNLCRGYYLKGICYKTKDGFFSELTDNDLEAKRFKTYKSAEKEYMKRKSLCYNIAENYEILECGQEEVNGFRRVLYGISYMCFMW